ncbi:MAG: pyridoxal phosphate-dependent aminotransferase, partial [Deltaproteobacteria bacterium]
MTTPSMSDHFASRQPSVIRISQIKFAQRGDDTQAINVAIGNVSLPMHPAMIERLHQLDGPDSPFRDGVVKYTATVGEAEANQAFLNIIAASGFSTKGLQAQITDGGSQAMELCVVGLCGPAGSSERPLLLIDAAYTNYKSFTERLGRPT